MFSKLSFYADTEKGKKDLKDLYEKLIAAIAHSRRRVLQSGFGDAWLGNIILECCPQFLHLSQEDVYCRYKGKRIPFGGFVSLLALHDEDPDNITITVETETKYEPMPDMWDMILAALEYTDIKYVFIAEELVDEIFVNTDIEGRFFSSKYRTEIYISDNYYCNDIQYFNCDKDLLTYLNDVIKDIREEYKHYPERYTLPKGFTLKNLRKQRSISKALQTIEDNLFEWNGCQGYIKFAEYDTSWG